MNDADRQESYGFVSLHNFHKVALFPLDQYLIARNAAWFPLLRILEVASSQLNPETGCLGYGFSWYPRFLC